MSTTKIKKSTIKRKIAKDGRDFGKVLFNGNPYGKGRVVLAVVNQYVKDHPNVTYADLRKEFPDTLHSLGVVKPLPAARKASAVHRRFYIDQAIKLKDKAVAVCSDFGRNNIAKFIKRAAELGYNIKMAA